MSLRIYLASRYSRRLELCGYREQLRAVGLEVQARWLDGSHQISDDGKPLGDDGEFLVESHDDAAGSRAAALRSRFALDDFEDVSRCDLLVAFTEEPRGAAGGRSRGGRHVELGIALGLGKPVLVVGPRENIFCWLEVVQQFDDFGGCLAALVSATPCAAAREESETLMAKLPGDFTEDSQISFAPPRDFGLACNPLHPPIAG